MRNVEYKTELRDLEAARAQCHALGARFMGAFQQIDTYFRVPDGRLKRRETSGQPVEFILYRRPDRLTARMSEYSTYTEEQARSRWGMVSLKEWLTVIKNRELFLLENVRIHLDRVRELGDYLEFEAVVRPPFGVKKCHEQVAELREVFRPITGETIAGSYSDLLARRIETPVDD
ncbi:MAG: class IV adenylate cyclase [Phycisphaerales bacterium]